LSKIDTTKQILSGLGIQSLYEPSRLRRMMTAASGAQNSSNLRSQDFIELYELVKAITKLNTTCNNLLQNEKIGKVQPGTSLLEVQVIDYDGNGIEPARLRIAITVLEDMYIILARLHEIKDDKLTFRYFDSGSDLIIGIQAAAVIIASVGALLLQWWDKGKFRRQETFMKDIEALSKGLEFLDKARESVEKGVITPEDALNLKVRVFQDANKLVGLGVMLPLKGTETVDQRQLLIERRDTKLLAAGKPEAISEQQPTEQAPPGHQTSVNTTQN